MTFVAFAIGLVALALSGVRWLRVAQREHYIPGSCRTTAGRWIRRRPPNSLLAVVAVVAAITTLVLRVRGSGTGEAVAAVVAAVLAAAFPWGMPVLGSPRLRFTPRAVRLAIITAVLAAVIGVLVGGVGAVAVVAVAMPLLVDGAAAIARPIERRDLERFRRQAEATLARTDPFVIAVTGSWGKTSTKNHIRDLLSGSADVVASPASWNNTAGLSRTINEHLGPATEVLVVEMGMYGPGEIRQLCSWIKPTVAVICAVGPMHLERVGSMDGIVAAKAEILERADTAVLWVDDPRLAALADTTSVPKVLRVGSRRTGRPADATGDRLDVEVGVDGDELVVWVAGERTGSVPTTSGAHPGNVGCAVAAALAYGMPASQLGRRLGALTNPDHRATTAVNDAGVLVIDDTFNANPVGALSAIDTLGRAVDGDRAVVTPGMVELGSVQDEENQRLARESVSSGATLVIVGWTNRRSLRAGATTTDRAPVVVRDRQAAVGWVRDHLTSGDGVLWENDLPDHYP
jgi:UDP-N-acetylmuramoyl-tripeptide--D-alanyl-D-alanine ligase